jgi:uncharacterized protein
VGARISVRLTPRGGRDAVTRWDGTTLHVRVAAAPVDNAANMSMTRLVAKHVGVPARAVRVVSGATARVKVVEVMGVEVADVLARLDAKAGRLVDG